MMTDLQSFIALVAPEYYFSYIIMFLNKISEEKFLWNSIYFSHYMLRILWPIKNLAQINMNYE